MLDAVTDDRVLYDQVIRAFGEVDGAYVDVGIREQDGGDKEAGNDLTLAQIAAVHEFGSSIRHGRSGGESVLVPERSFLRGWEHENRPEAVRRIGKAVERVLLRDESPDRALGQVGLWAVRGVRRRIRSGIEPELAPSTIRRKGSTTPLIDTGRLINTIDFETGNGGAK